MTANDEHNPLLGERLPERPSQAELLANHDSVAAVENRLEDLRPSLPEQYEGMSSAEIRDSPAYRGTDEEAWALVEWVMFDQWASDVRAKAHQRY